MADDTVTVTVTPDKPDESIPDDADLTQHAVELPGGGESKKFVPLGALQAERSAKQVVAERLKTLQAEVEQLRPVRQQLEQARPYLEALQRRPDLLQQALSQTAPSTRQTAASQQDDEALKYAERFELFDKSGQLDARRAREILDDTKQQIQAEVRQQIAPLAQQTAHDKAEGHRQWARGYVQSGQVSEEAYQAFVATVPDQVLANPQAAQAALMMAMGQTTFAGKGKPVTHASEDEGEPRVVLTESPGRREASVPALNLSPAMKAVLAARGKSEADLQKFVQKMNTRDTSKGVPLED